MSSVQNPSSQASKRPAKAAGLNFGISRDNSSSLIMFVAWSLFVHLFLVFTAWLVVTIAQFLGWHIPLFAQAQPKPRDLEFVLVDDSPKAPPRRPTKNRAEHASRSGGEKKANQPTQMPQRAAGAPSKKAAAKPTVQPRPAAKPQPQPRQAARPTSRPAQQPHKVAQQQPAPQPTPRRAPPAPRAVRPVKTPAEAPAMPSSRSAPTIRTPAPRNPGIASGGSIVSSPSSSGSNSGGSSGGGNPGPTMIAGNPSRGGAGSPGMSGSRAGGGGSGGRGSYNQNGSPGGGGGRNGIDAEAEPDFGPYIAELQRRIKRNWAPPTEDRNKRVVVIFHIARDGRLLNVRVKGTSGSPSADQAALAAVRLSAPFRPLPPNYRGKDIPVEFTFDYQVFGGGGGGAKMR